MAKKIPCGSVALTAGTKAPTLVLPISDTLSRLQIRVAGSLVVSSGLTLTEDGVLNLLRQINLSIGGVPFKVIGDNSRYGSAGKLCYFFNQLQYGNLPPLNQVAVGTGTNAFNFTVTVPIELPQLLSPRWPNDSARLTMLSPTTKDIELDIYWGDTGDVFSAGSATFSGVTAEVIGIVHPNLNHVRMPLLLNETTQQVQIQAGLNSDDRQDLNKVGTVPYIGFLAVDNGLRNDANFNAVKFYLNGNVVVLQQSWGAMKAAAQEAAGIQATGGLATGVNMALFDDEGNAEGVIELEDTLEVKAWKLSTDHAALTGTFRLYAHHFYLLPQ